MENTNEALLQAWLRLSTAISNERIVSGLSYNESRLCNILYRSRLQNPERRLTATDLCRQMKMQKSQMNRTLTSLEKRQIIRRERSTDDRRQIFILLNPDRAQLYEQQHQDILSLIDTLLDRIGRERSAEIIALFHKIAETAEEVMK